MKKCSLILSVLLTTTAFYGDIKAQCNVVINREAYNTNSPCELPVVLRAVAGMAPQNIVWYENGNVLQSYDATWATAFKRVAGTGTAGVGTDQLQGPSGIWIDRSGNVFVADKSNHRVQKWAPGATSGVTVAGTGTAGSGATELNSPSDVFLDSIGNLYISDAGNHRVQKWAPGATSGTTVAGNGTSGTGNNQLNNPAGVFATEDGTVIVADAGNHRVQKWSVGASSGVTIAGNGTAGNGANQLNQPWGVHLDKSGNLYVADKNNHRVQKWDNGASTGATVAGDGTAGFGSGQLNSPNGIYVDGLGNMYIAEGGNFRVVFWQANARAGVTIADHSMGARPTPNVTGVCLDSAGNLYMSDNAKNYVLKYEVELVDTLLVLSPAEYVAVVNSFSGCESSDTLYVNALQQPTIRPAGAHTICEGDQLTLRSSQTNGATYEWFLDGNSIPRSNDSVFQATEAGKYTLVVSNGRGCEVAAADTVTITVNPLPNPVITDNNGTLSTSGTFDSYQWNRDGNAIQGATNSSYEIDGDGSYTVTVTDDNGCSATSRPLNYHSNISDKSLNKGVRIFPNPAQSELFIESNFAVTATMYSVDGRLIASFGNGRFDLSTFPQGWYLIRITDSEGNLVHTDKLIKQ